jgi:NAD(P)-dependent dehydrogenase (short-subunit alcohol dehydrogenase family)
MTIRFDDQVAIVTGAGAGIGECIALELARRGAAVVVNDYGGDMLGKPGTIDRAAEVARKITEAGGRAIADGSEVGAPTVAETLVRKAVETFGRIDIVANNAGNLGSGDIDATDEGAFLKVLRVHLIGSRALMRAAWPRMRAQRYGRILNTLSSVAFGREGYSNYGAAKGGLMGLTRSAGLEGAPLGILVNGILPSADTRMTRAGFDAAGEPNLRDWFISHFGAWKVAAAAAYLVSQELEVSGEMFVVGGGRLACVGFAVARGYFDPNISAEGVRENFRQVMDFENAPIVRDNRAEQDTYLSLLPRA